jgi:hypothetical protein
MSRIKVRFNLGKGPRYMKWKIQYPNGDVDYIDPNKCVLKLKNCSLHNNRNTANKILLGANKTVCAWILCDEMHIEEAQDKDLDESQRLRYNPREAAHWIYRGLNVDGVDYEVIVSSGNKLYVYS